MILALPHELHGATDTEIGVFRALVEMTRANNGHGARDGYPGAFAPMSIARRACALHAMQRGSQVWHNLCVNHGLISDAQHPLVTLYRLTEKGREVGDAAFPASPRGAGVPPAPAMDYTAEACLRADPEAAS